MVRKQFYPELESLRGLAALSVVVLHGNLVFGPPTLADPLKIVLFACFPGNSAVPLFFVLSGFVLSQSILASCPNGEPIPFFGYVVRRLFRMLPAMAAAVALSIVVAIVVDLPVDWVAATKALVFESYTIDPPMWTMKPEFYLSVFFIPVAALATVQLSWQASIVFVVALAIHYSMPWLEPLLCFAYMFYLGCLVTTVGRWIVEHLHGLVSIVVFSIALIVFCFATPVFDIYGPNSLPDVMNAVALPSFLFVSYLYVRADGDGAVVSFFRLRFVRFLGKISFSLYLMHWPISILLQKSVMPYIPTFVVHHKHLFFVLLLTSVSIAVAWASYQLVEAPFIKLGRWVSGKTARPVAATP